MCDPRNSNLPSTERVSDENEPLVPASTSFLLTTDASLLTGGTGPEKTLGINTKANSRYFERPEVLKAYKEQEEIQTPEFESLSEDASVGGRFRPRELEDVCNDLSLSCS